MSADLERNTAERKLHGAHYTPAALAAFVAEQILESCDLTSGAPIRVLDPAAGDGSLLAAMLDALSSRGLVGIDAVGFDTSPVAVHRAKSQLSRFRSARTITLLLNDFLASTEQANELQMAMFDDESPNMDLFDIVIANPPYVRTQVMGAQMSKQLSGRYDLSGRIDLYFAFVRAVAHVLRRGGIAGLIVSNRFMTTQSGASLRQSILQDFDVLRVFDFGDTRLFDAAVLPAVLLLKRKTSTAPQDFPAPYVSIYSTRAQGDESAAETVFDAIRGTERVRLGSGDTFAIRHGHLDVGVRPTSVWRLANRETDDWLATVSSRAPLTFGDIGPLRVGVKTTADKVFIRADWETLDEACRPELLRPIATHHAARRFRGLELDAAPKILYTHEVRDGRRRPIDLDQYPKAARYLESHRVALESRSYVQEAGRKWFEIWVPQDPAAWSAPKLVWRDISERPVFWMDYSGAVVNGDCYWLSAPPGREHLLWLALAVANSRLAETFYDHCFSNRLYARRRRFITQYVRRFPLPDPNTDLAQQMIRLCREIYDRTPSTDCEPLTCQLDDLISKAFSLRREEGRWKGNLQFLI